MTKILIAEDDKDIRELVVLTLEFNDFEVDSVENGVEAVERAQNTHYDLILMDVRMPRMTGYDACRQLKAIDATKDIPIIFLSAKGQGQEIQTGLEVGAIDYILKPFTPNILVDRINALLAQLGKSSP